MSAFAAANLPSKARATQFTLPNGMDVVVIADHRAPVVTHMVWYRVGAGDDPAGVSGIAHFLEHLMFKSTDKILDGAFPKIVMRQGGQLNAYTTQDTTAYYERVSKDQLRMMMELEADRMTGLRLTEEEVATERNVIIEERASRVDNNPAARLGEQMSAALYLAHPYGTPVIGWAHEIAQLTREDALRFYRRHYAPNNAILVVAGDVTPDAVKFLAEQTYGVIAANPAVGRRVRPKEPTHEVARRMTLKDKRVGHASFHRTYLAPSYVTAEPGTAEALSLLMYILGDGATGRLYRRLVLEDKVATSVAAGYYGGGLDSGEMSIVAESKQGDLKGVERAIDRVIEDVRSDGVAELELERAKRVLRASYVFDSDDQERLANRYGWSMATGRTIEEIEAWPSAIAKVTAEDVKAAANDHLDPRRSVTGLLLPDDETAP